MPNSPTEKTGKIQVNLNLRSFLVKRKAGLKGGPHTLRHTFGAHLASAGVPLHTLAKLMGHSSVQITEIYAHLAPDIQ